MTLLFQFSHSHFFPFLPLFFFFFCMAVIQVAYIVLVFFFLGEGATLEKLESMTFFEYRLAGVITRFFEGNRGAERSNFPQSHVTDATF